MPTIIQKIKSAIGFQPQVVAADMEQIRRSVANDEQKQRAANIVADYGIVSSYGEKAQHPSSRVQAVLWYFDVKELADLSGETRSFAESVSHTQESGPLLRFQGLLNERRQEVATRAATLVAELRCSYIPLLDDELARYRAELVDLFAAYGVEDHVESARPLRLMHGEHGQHRERDPAKINLGHDIPRALGDFITPA